MTMRRWLAWWLALLALLVLPAASAQQAVPAPVREPPPAIERFFAPPAMQGAMLSPSGRWLGALATIAGGRVGFHVVDLDGQEAPRTVEAASGEEVTTFMWASDDWVLFGLRDTERRAGVVSDSPLLAMRRDGSDVRRIRGYGHSFLGLGPPGSLDVILAEGHYSFMGELMHVTLSAVNIVTQKWRRIHEDVPRAISWRFDPQGRPRLITQGDDKQIRYLWSAVDGDKIGPWREIAVMPRLQPAWHPAYIDGDGRLFVTLFDAQGSMELRAFDFATGRPAATAVLATPGFSGGVTPRRDWPSGSVIGVNLALDATTAEWFTPAMKALQDRVDARWPGRVNLIQCQPCDAPRRVLVFSYADNDPGQFLLYQPPLDKWQLIGSVQPDIDPARMARMSFERFRARDGREVPLWVTRLPGKPDKPLPAVVMPHGGPFMRGSAWHWDADAQFLASRGYVVIEPEFRGSTGYGDQHYRAGWKQWGGAMIDDITDALRHLVAAGLVDSKRVCVMGGSYGGYAALMSLVKEPELYRCAIAHAALSDLRHRFDFHWSDISDFHRRVMLPVILGDPHDDAALFAATSPVEQARRIKTPLLLVHGEDDRRVPVENAERMRDALKKAGVPFEWQLYPDEGHGFSRPANQLDYWRRVEQFLAKHLH